MGEEQADMSDMIVNKENIKSVAGALASQTRLDIIDMISKKSMNVTEISSAMNMPISSAISAVKKLEEAGVVKTDADGRKKVCSIPYENLILELKGRKAQEKKQSDMVVCDVPIGGYFDYQAMPSCGLVGDRLFIGELDNEDSFALPDKTEACLIYLRKGYLKYRVLCPRTEGKHIQSVSVSFEICSEFPGYNNNYKSNIDCYINGKYIGTWTAPGDYGGRHGIFTPHWWSLNNTQFGDLVMCCITQDGTFMNTRKVSDVNVDGLMINSRDYFELQIETRDAGGFNLFGKNFGDYDQDIVIKFHMASDEDTGKLSLAGGYDESMKQHFNFCAKK